MGRVLWRPSTCIALARDTAKLVHRCHSGLYMIYRECRHKGGKRFIQPQSIPPTHSDQVTEPHMRIFMGDDIRNSLRVRGEQLSWYQ